MLFNTTYSYSQGRRLLLLPSLYVPLAPEPGCGVASHWCILVVEISESRRSLPGRARFHLLLVRPEKTPSTGERRASASKVAAA